MLYIQVKSLKTKLANHAKLNSSLEEQCNELKEMLEATKENQTKLEVSVEQLKEEMNDQKEKVKKANKEV